MDDKQRPCFGEFNAWDFYCTKECSRNIACLRLKVRVLMSCIPSEEHMARIAEVLRIDTGDDIDEVSMGRPPT